MEGIKENIAVESSLRDGVCSSKLEYRENIWT